jgi:hypothetical protein
VEEGVGEKIPMGGRERPVKGLVKVLEVQVEGSERKGEESGEVEPIQAGGSESKVER